MGSVGRTFQVVLSREHHQMRGLWNVVENRAKIVVCTNFTDIMMHHIITKILNYVSIAYHFNFLPPIADGICEDLSHNCELYVPRGDCTNNQEDWMAIYCKKSCGKCGKSP